jgi:hypothetical protein
MRVRAESDDGDSLTHGFFSASGGAGPRWSSRSHEGATRFPRQWGRHFNMTFACAYNLFGHKTKPDLYCAVPEDCPVPRVLNGRRWRFAGRLTNVHAVPGVSDARTGDKARRKGYFLFLACPKCGPHALAA